jgi:uncharacterized protein (TIGR02246 family)
MPARTPGDCDRLFEERVNAGDVEGVVTLYEEGGSLVQHDGGVASGHAAIRGVIARLVAMRPRLRNDVVRVVKAGEDLAVLYNDWVMSATGRDGLLRERAGKAIEVVRRQPDGTWRFVIDDPYARG